LKTGEKQMKTLLKSFLTIFAVMVMAAPSYADSQAVIGEAAPAFTLTDIDGNTHSLNDFRGKTVVLEWTNHECPYVIKHYDTGNMQKLQQEATANDDVVWLTIVSSAPGKQGHSSAEEAKMIIEKDGIKATARLMDESGNVGRMYGAMTTPHMYVINAAGTLAYMGAIDDNPSARHSSVETAKNYITPALAALKAGEMPDIKQTKPYGCSIKYGAS